MIRREPRQQAHRHHRQHRIRRHRPGRAAAARRSRVRAGPARPAEQAPRPSPSECAREIFKNDAFDRLRAELDGTAEPFEAMVARRVTTIGGDVSTDGLGLNDDDRALVRRRATSSSTPPPPWRSTRRSTRAVEINLLGPTRIADTLNAARHHAAPRRRQHVLRRRQPPRQRARGTRQRGTVRPRAQLAQGGRRGPTAAQRHRGRSAASPTSSRHFRERSPQGARRRRRPGAGRARPSSSAKTGSRTSWSRPAGPAPRASVGPTPTRTRRRSASRR